ncbi:MAG: spondin domain-containing protein [Phycisphaerales bacterium]
MRSTALAFATTLAVLTTTAAAGTPMVARYRATFEGLWTEQTHPTDFPGNPHFSPLIGVTHNADAVFWEPGGIATFGIERMAEAGRTQELQVEIDAEKLIGNADSGIRQIGINSPGSVHKEFNAHESHPLVTLVTMVAPSPDWFVGVHSVPLFVDGVWVDKLVFDLMPYDAGTDAGVTFNSPNEDITPHIPIVEIGDAFPFNSGGPVARLTFERVDINEGGCSPADLAEPLGQLDFNDVVAFLTAFGAGDPATDLAPPLEQLDFTDVTTFVILFSQGCP